MLRRSTRVVPQDCHLAVLKSYMRAKQYTQRTPSVCDLGIKFLAFPLSKTMILVQVNTDSNDPANDAMVNTSTKVYARR